jgi:hypothetical protein
MIYRTRHFTLSELVCPHVLEAWGSMAWPWIDERLAMTIDFLRDQFKAPIYVNNYDMPEDVRLKLGLPLFDERGLRCIQCDIVKKASKAGRVYCSSHIRFQAVDFNVHGMTPDNVSLWLLSNYLLLPFPIRVEKGTKGWTHLDTSNAGTNKVELFVSS